MTEEEKRPREVPQKRGRPYAGGALLLITITIIIITLFTGGIAYSIQSMGGSSREKVDEGVMVNGVREFRIVASQWDFVPAKIRLNPGETVRFIVTSSDITHGFAINELGINLALPPGEEVVKEVVVPPDAPSGVYTMYCSIFCGIGHSFMKGESIIGKQSGIELGKVLPYTATAVMAVISAALIIIWRRRER